MPQTETLKDACIGKVIPLNSKKTHSEPGHTPNQETIEAIKDSRADGGETFHNIDSLFGWLNEGD